MKSPNPGHGEKEGTNQKKSYVVVEKTSAAANKAVLSS